MDIAGNVHSSYARNNLFSQDRVNSVNKEQRENCCALYRNIEVICFINRVDVDVAVDFMLPSNGSSGVFLAARVVTGGCDTMYSDGIFLWVLPQKKAYSLVLTGNFSKCSSFTC